MFKIAYCAGHYINTPGKRVPKALDPDQTREWTLNDRVADYFNLAALEYEGVQTLRTDDPTGSKHISIKNRTKKANDWGADLYLDMHHNAGISLGKGGGVVVYCYPGSEAGRSIQKAVYEEIIASGGLKGNRAKPLGEKKFDTLKYAKAPALIIEYGFMDSRTDYPIISTDSYAKLVAYATMAAVAKVYNLKKRTDAQENQPAATQKTEVCTVEVKVLKKGAKGDQVKAMQTLLIGYGFSCGDKGTDGSFGAATDKAVRAFQKARGLSVDGSCGPKTWAKLLGVG